MILDEVAHRVEVFDSNGDDMRARVSYSDVVKPECGRFSSPILDPLSRQMPLSYAISSTPLPLNLPGLISLLP